MAQLIDPSPNKQTNTLFTEGEMAAKNSNKLKLAKIKNIY